MEMTYKFWSFIVNFPSLIKISSIALLLGTSAAQSNELSGATTDWTGFYAGAHVGYGWADSDVSTDGGFWGAGSTSIEPEDWLAGIQGGYWFERRGNIRFGIDAQYSWSDMDETEGSPAVSGDKWSSEIDGIALIQARVGREYDKGLLFVQAGYAGVDSEAEVGNPALIASQSGSDSNWHHGWTIGAGASYWVSQSVSVGVEYNYIDTQSENYDWGCSTCGAGSNEAKLDHEIHVFKVNANFHF